MMIIIMTEDGDMKTGISIGVVVAVMFTIPALSESAREGVGIPVSCR